MIATAAQAIWADHLRWMVSAGRIRSGTSTALPQLPSWGRFTARDATTCGSNLRRLPTNGFQHTHSGSRVAKNSKNQVFWNAKTRRLCGRRRGLFLLAKDERSGELQMGWFSVEQLTAGLSVKVASERAQRGS
jgi:hypothetical protein